MVRSSRRFDFVYNSVTSDVFRVLATDNDADETSGAKIANRVDVVISKINTESGNFLITMTSIQ